MDKIKYRQNLRRDRVKRGKILLQRYNQTDETMQEIGASQTDPISRQCVHSLIKCARSAIK